MVSVPENKNVLLKRLRRFIEDVPYQRKPLFSFLNEIKGVSDVYLFGGFVREIGLSGIIPFKSDIDIVVRVSDRNAFNNFISCFDFSKNKFGGYRIIQPRWLIDLWEFEDTWAFEQGYVKPVSVGSLLQTTFFDWDAVIYDLFRDKIYCDEKYISKLSNRILDINLPHNPNPKGAFIRALRFICRDKVKTGKVLSQFIVDNLCTMADEEIFQYERLHFNVRYLLEDHLVSIRSKVHEWGGQDAFIWLKDDQLDLFNN